MKVSLDSEVQPQNNTIAAHGWPAREPRAAAPLSPGTAKLPQTPQTQRRHRRDHGHGFQQAGKRRRRTGSAVSISACFESRLAERAAAPVAEAECHSPAAARAPKATRWHRGGAGAAPTAAGLVLEGFTQESGESLYAGVSIWKEDSVF